MTSSKKRERDASIDTAVIDISRREVGRLSTRKFFNRIAASEDLVLRLHLSRKLEKHRGCVNTVSFNGDGDVLVSGSDDRKVIFWDWEHGNVKLSFYSGHDDNIFQAKIMPGTDDRSIVTCAADGQLMQGYSKLLLRISIPLDHEVAYLGVLVMFFVQYEYARLYDIRHYKWDSSTDFGKPSDHFCPRNLIGDENLGITGLAFSDQSELLASYLNDSIYLFSKDMGLGSDVKAISDNSLVSSDSEMETDGKDGPQAYKGHRNCETVKGVNFFGPKCEYVVSGSDCGRMFIWRKSDSELIRVMEADKQVVNCIEAHPRTTMLASSGLERDIKIWTPSAVDKATLPTNIDEEIQKPVENIHELKAYNIA
ncbi:DDB1- and CUL4-associated factor 8 [Artemisia annua]|uniref:DDB1-and CUL4-associated factor 8 n=1 Tax=Artemisia annua TaxID=35608 RepID=A0A2U1MNQ6_ARTAN|nr:DDB1- and CUL4-associated factor 8 [Artemisia annua]